jgi:cell division protein FtsN
MARDYKHRTSTRRIKHSQTDAKVSWWRWLLVILLIAGFAWGLSFLGDSAPEKQIKTVTRPLPVEPVKPAKKMVKKPAKPEPEQVEPQFDFYNLLESKEVRIPEYEIKTRVREEKVGKAKSAQYYLQVGSFREYQEADKLKARLAFMGIQSKIEKAKVGNIIWNRLKIGPYAKLSTVERVSKRLKSEGIATIVTELKG